MAMPFEQATAHEAYVDPSDRICMAAVHRVHLFVHKS